MSTKAQQIRAEDETPETELPEGWAATRIKNALLINYGKGLKESDRSAGDVPVYGSNGIVGSHTESLTNGPAIIIGRKGTVGAVHFSPIACWPIDTTYFVDDFGGLDAQYLTSWLRTLKMGDLDTSTAIPGLNRDDIYAQPLVLAPIIEQERIASKIAELFEQVRSTRKRLAKVSAVLKHFRQAVLAGACSGKLTEDWRIAKCIIDNKDGPAVNAEHWPELPETWRIENVNSVSSVIVDCPHSTPKWTSKGVICLRTTNFRSGLLDLSEVRFVSEDTYRKRVARLVPVCDDVLYSREGGILGLACLFPANIKACLGQRMMLMRADPAVVMPTFLMHVLNCDFTFARVKDLTTGSASPHLNVGEIKEFAVPVPPLQEQDEIVRRVDKLFKLADAIEKRVAAATLRAEKLTQAVLAKAFRGELVPTEAELARREGREYEPASVLIGRIKAEREKAEEKPKRGKRVRAVVAKA